jgi:hypothetical protein
MMELKLNSIYKHYKGKYYKTLFFCNNASNSDSPLIIYQSLYKDENFGDKAIWARTILEFQELYDGVNPRFEFICELPIAMTF